MGLAWSLRPALPQRERQVRRASGVGERVARLRHLAAVDDWLAELDAAHGPVPPETLEWGARLIDQWEAQRQPRRAG